MRHILHANCFPPDRPEAQTLLTDEALVAAAARPDLTVVGSEERVSCELAHATSVEMARRAFTWFRCDGEDHTGAAGISAGDLGGAEAAFAILIPAARAVLAMDAALDAGLEPETLISVVPAGQGRYARVETLAAEAAIATVRARHGAGVTVERLVSHDARNAWLREKYSHVRDPDYLALTGSKRKLARRFALGVSNAHSRLRRRGHPALMVLEYHPSHAFARDYGARRSRSWRLVCWPAEPHDLLAIARAGDEAILPPAPDLAGRAGSPIGESLGLRRQDLEGSSLRVAGVELWPLICEPLLALVERYAHYAESLARPIRRELEHRAVRAVLVPFDTPPHARLIVRVAQSMGIPTFVINDGFKADDIQQEGMTADVALAWSEAMRDCYYARRSNGAIVAGNPRMESLPTRVGRRGRGPQRVLVGGHTFSPIDLNCRRSDAERFLEQVLEGIAANREHVHKEVVVKLHPADTPIYYRAILERYPRLSVELRTSGDVTEMFAEFDVYVTTYSTSLLEAAAVGLPIVYYRVNGQKMGPPFSADAFLARRSASTPQQLARLLGDRDTLATPPPRGWVERYLGPADAVDRIVGAIDAHIASGPMRERYRPKGV